MDVVHTEPDGSGAVIQAAVKAVHTYLKVFPALVC